MKKDTRNIVIITDVILYSIISIIIDALTFIPLYRSTMKSGYMNLELSLEIIFFNIISIIAFVILICIKPLRLNIIYLIFSTFFFFSLMVYAIIVAYYIGHDVVYWILSLLNLSFTIYFGLLTFRKIKLEKELDE